MTISIKNMVCNRCISAVEAIFDEQKIPISAIHLGEVETSSILNAKELKSLNAKLSEIGFEILEDASKKQIELIKKLIIKKISEEDISEDFILSEFLVAQLHKDYSSISKLFSQNENVTLEQFFILQKIEKVKELMFEKKS